MTSEFPTQRASNAENVSICWRHHESRIWIAPIVRCWYVFFPLKPGQNGGHFVDDNSFSWTKITFWYDNRAALIQIMAGVHYQNQRWLSLMTRCNGLLRSSLWCHNGHDGVSNHQPPDCLLSRLFRRKSKKISKLRVTGLCEGNSTVTGEFPAQRASNAENVSFDDVIIYIYIQISSPMS